MEGYAVEMRADARIFDRFWMLRTLIFVYSFIEGYNIKRDAVRNAVAFWDFTNNCPTDWWSTDLYEIRDIIVPEDIGDYIRSMDEYAGGLRVKPGAISPEFVKEFFADPGLTQDLEARFMRAISKRADWWRLIDAMALYAWRSLCRAMAKE